MTGLGQLILTFLLTLVAAFLPGLIAVRALGGSRLLALSLAPALSAAVAGIGAMITPAVGADWNLVSWAVSGALLVLAAIGLRVVGIRLPMTTLDHSPAPRLSPTSRLGWATALIAALAVATAPIMIRAGRPNAVLERYDTLFHLTALARIRETGNGSSLELNAIANTALKPASYPAAFHDLASLTPGVEIPIQLNGAGLALAIVPWVLGCALLARVVFPRTSWAAPLVAVVAALLPASPLNLWIHLSPIPNLVGFSMLPGAFAGAAALWFALTVNLREVAEDADAQDHATRRVSAGGVIASVLVVAFAGIGLALLHPNTAVTALILLAVLMGATTWRLWRNQPWLIALPLIALLPVAALSWTPLGARVTGFSGGLKIPWWSALAEVGLGLWTVWPMALGVVMAAVWWPGLITLTRSAQRWLVVAWGVIVVLYLDAAVDSPLNLSVLYFRGQDRIAIPLAMLSALFMVPGVQAWNRALASLDLLSTPRRLGTVSIIAVAVAIAVVYSVPVRLDNAAKNLAENYAGRGRFLQADELAAFAEVAPQLDSDRTILASPYSGAAHMYALHGLHAYFPVAGVAVAERDRASIEAVAQSATSPGHCRTLQDQGIGYVYQESDLYQYDPTFTPLNSGGDELGPVVFETNHSRLIEVDCDGGSTED